MQDSRVRPEHADRNGETYSWKQGAGGEHPGQPVRCRCRAEAVWGEAEGSSPPVTAESVAEAKEQARDAAFRLSLNGPGKDIYVRKVMPIQEENLPEKANFDIFSKASGKRGSIDISELIAIQDRVDLQKVNEYIDALARGDRFPPVKVVRSGGKVFLLDGHHRTVASKLLGIKNIGIEDIT